MLNATYLTEKYAGEEETLWTPCFRAFLGGVHPLRLPVSKCTGNPPGEAPYYELRKKDPSLLITRADKVFTPRGAGELLAEIKSRFDMFKVQDSRRYPEGKDIAGIQPDLVIVQAAISQENSPRIYLIENKPYYESGLTGNQMAGGDYARFLKWLNECDVPCQLLILQSISWRRYNEVVSLQDTLSPHFGVLLIEDLFEAMQRCHFQYSPITDTEQWGNYVHKGQDFAWPTAP